MSRADDWTDKDVKAAFIKMVMSIALCVAWFLFSIFWGVIKDFAFFDDPHIPWWQHGLFYLWIVVSLPILVWVIFVKIWKLKR